MDIDFERITALVVRIQGGDDSAFDELYHLTSKRAFFLAKEFVKNDEDAEDILQDSYIKALEKIKELKNPETFVSWFNRIVANKSKDYIKKKKPSLFECDEDEAYEVIPDERTEFSPEENADKENLRLTVMQALDELSEDKKACIVMMYYEENSINEIAQCLEIPEGTVKTRLYHGRNELKRCFERAGVTSLYSAAPIGIIIWALKRTAQTAQASFAASPAYTSVLAGVKAAAVSTAAAATAAGTATAGATAAAVTSTTAATATGAAVATGVTAKVVAIVAAGAVVIGGGAVGAKVIHVKRAEQATTAVAEESTEFANRNIAVAATENESGSEITVEFEESTIIVSNKNGTTVITVTPRTTASRTTNKTGGTTAAAVATQPNTSAPTTANVTTTAKPTEKTTTAAPNQPTESDNGFNYVGSVTSTTKQTTTTTTTTAATTKPTTTQAPITTELTTVGTAKIVIDVYNGSLQKIKTIDDITVNAGDYITEEIIISEALRYKSEYGDNYTEYITIDGGDTISSAPGAQAGQTYNYIVVVS